MSAAVEAIRADRAALVKICADLTPPQWAAPSGCAGWTVQDVLTHLSNLFWLVVDPARLPAVDGLATELAQDRLVQARRGIPAADVLAEYEEVGDVALDRLAGLAEMDVEVELGDLGTYPAAVLPHAYSFDHYTHIRADLFGPRGPLTGPPPPSDELRVAAALDWIAAALPQQNKAAAIAATIEIQVTGTGARLIPFGSGQAMATISSDAPALVRWVTQRGGWADLGVQAAGDEPALATARTLKVF